MDNQIGCEKGPFVFLFPILADFISFSYYAGRISNTMLTRTAGHRLPCPVPYVRENASS